MAELALVVGRKPELCAVFNRAGLRSVFFSGDCLAQAARTSSADLVVIELGDSTAAANIGLALDVLREAPQIRLLLIAGSLSHKTFDRVLSVLPGVPVVSVNADPSTLRGAVDSTLLEPRPESRLRLSA